ncbi:MAG: VPLPA-CTERM sorting domain-containing protein [Pseudomonadota bacterium]
MFRKTIYTVTFLLTAVTLSAHATFVDPNFSGASEYEGWSDMTRTRLPGYPDPTMGGSSTDLWPMPIAPNDPGSAGNAEFDKISGGGYPAGSSIYNSFTPGNFTITNDNPLANLATVLFQIETGASIVSAPVLNYNGGTQAMTADITFNGTGPIDNTYGFQWDLSGVVDVITSFDIDWGTSAFAANYAMQLDSADSFSPVPVPAAFWLLVSACGGLFGATRRRS